MFEMKSNIFQRGFSSHEQEAEEKVPVIRQLICHDEYDLKNTKLVPLRECLLEKTIVKPISPAGLFEQADLLKFGNLVFGDLSRPVLRQLARLATVNLMRGLNISELIHLDNILWSHVYQGIVLKEVTLTIDSEASSECPYDAGRKVYIECLEISTGITVEKVRLPEEVTNYLLLLKNAKQVDKRLITNHSATKYPWERMQRNSRLNQLLRQDLPKHILKTTTDEDQLLIKSCAENVFTDLAFEFPLALLMSRGLQKVVNHWAREGQSMRGIKAGESPVVLPNSTIEGLRAGSIKDVYELIAAIEQDPGAPVELGKIMVALHRDPFEHLYEPLKRGLWPRSYNVLDVEQLLNGVNPAFGPTVERSFLERGMWHLWDVNPGSKPPYLYWTNVNWAPNRSEEN